MPFTTTPLQCASFLPEEVFTHSHAQEVLLGGRDRGDPGCLPCGDSPEMDPRAHLRKKLRFHRGKNRSSSSTGSVEENGRIFPSIRWKLTRLSGFLPHRLPFRARD